MPDSGENIALWDIRTIEENAKRTLEVRNVSTRGSLKYQFFKHPTLQHVELLNNAQFTLHF